MRIFLLVIGISMAVSAQAEDVYKSVDEDGNTIYTDVPTADGEKIQIKNVQPIETAPVEPAESSPDQEPRFVVVIINKDEKELKRSNPISLTLYRHRGRK